jgi:hypothetical protein
LTTSTCSFIAVLTWSTKSTTCPESFRAIVPCLLRCKTCGLARRSSRPPLLWRSGGPVPSQESRVNLSPFHIWLAKSTYNLMYVIYRKFALGLTHNGGSRIAQARKRKFLCAHLMKGCDGSAAPRAFLQVLLHPRRCGIESLPYNAVLHLKMPSGLQGLFPATLAPI